jgi:hypothetical protein
MRIFGFVTFLFFVLTSVVAGQEKPKAYVLTPFDHNLESEKQFENKLRHFTRSISRNPHISGYVSIRGRSSKETWEFRQLALKVVGNNPRVGISLGAPGYEPPIDRTAFWVVPEGADAPYILRHLNMECPIIKVVGNPVSGNLKDRLVFTAEAVGVDSIQYKWAVTGGKILEGQVRRVSR